MSGEISTIIQFHLPVSIAQKILTNVGKGKIFKNKSEAYRTLLQRGLQLEKLRDIGNDPEKKQKFEELLRSVVTQKHDRRTFETMEVEDLENIIFLATEVKNKKVEQ